jgi:Domain of unknown function (DUF4126)
VDLLPVVVGTGWTSGLSAYGTALVLGLLGRSGLDQVPDVLTRGEILIPAGLMFGLEFVVDKIPYLDNIWDAVHTVIRPILAGMIGLAFAGDADAVGEALAATGTGTIALLSHGVKAGLRLAVNASPEPFSTIAVSSVEDLAMAGVSYLVATHPWIAFAIAAALLTGGILLVVAIRRRIRRFLQGRRSRGKNYLFGRR